MADLGDSITTRARILISRNTPVALVVGAAGFLGSHLVEELLKKGIQVIGVDDFSSGSPKNLEQAIKDRRFHLLNQSISPRPQIELPRLDYAFWVIGKTDGLSSFLSWVAKFQPKITLISSIELYGKHLYHSLLPLKHSEIELAKASKEHQLNARVVRLAPLFGPRMNWWGTDPVSRLIQASLLEELQSEQTSLDFSSRALYVSDAVGLILKSALSGGTAGQIYDGVLPSPIKVSEIKQVLLDPLWYEKRGFTPSEMPPWSTPNLKKSLKELNWRPRVGLIEGLKKTISYFKDHQIVIPRVGVRELEQEIKRWNREQGSEVVSPLVTGDSSLVGEKEKNEQRAASSEIHYFGHWVLLGQGLKRRLGLFLSISLILYALIFPLISLGLGSILIRHHLIVASEQIKRGELDSATSEITSAQGTLKQLETLMGSLSLLRRLNILTSQINIVSELTSILDQVVDGISHATLGTKQLLSATKVISGESSHDPNIIYQQSYTEFQSAQSELSAVEAKLSDPNLKASLPVPLSNRVDDLITKLGFYDSLVEKARVASGLLPEMTGVSSPKVYLLLLENNLELRPAGGKILNYAQLSFNKGKLTDLKVDTISSLDSQLKDHIEPPAELKSDLGVTEYNLLNSNFDPDFPTSAKLAQFLYNKEVGVRVNGVMALDFEAMTRLVGVVGGVDLTDFGEHIDSNNLYTKILTHQADPKYLTALETSLLNKIFFLSSQNWSALASALSDVLNSKHLVLYFDDSQVFSFASSQNWAGVLPRQGKINTNQAEDFLGIINSNMGQNQVDLGVEKKLSLQSSLTSEGLVLHHLDYTFNNKGSDLYKDRLRVYLPLGTRLNKALWGEDNITKELSTFSDYGRTGYSMLINVLPKENKKLTLEYQLDAPLPFKDSQVNYSLYFFKQVGEKVTPVSWDLNFPPEIKLISLSGKSVTSGNQVVHLETDLSQDRTLRVGLSK